MLQSLFQPDDGNGDDDEDDDGGDDGNGGVDNDEDDNICKNGFCNYLNLCHIYFILSHTQAHRQYPTYFAIRRWNKQDF